MWSDHYKIPAMFRVEYLITRMETVHKMCLLDLSFRNCLFEQRETFMLSSIHTSCECEANFEVTGLLSPRMFCRSWAHFNCCKLFVANLWRQNSLRIRRKYETGFNHVQIWMLTGTSLSFWKKCLLSKMLQFFKIS